MQSALGRLQDQEVSDYDAPSAFWVSSPRARKKHRCGECYNDIMPGETYEKVAGVWCGEFNHFKTCLACARLREWLVEQEVDWCFEGVHEAFHESGMDDEIPAMLLIGMQAQR